MIQVVSILTSIAFGGVIIVVLGLIFFGGGGTSAADQLQQTRNDLLKAAQADPKNPDAWQDLAFAYIGTKETGKAVVAAKRALALDPNDFDRVQSVASIQQQAGDADGAISTLQAYTVAHPKDAQAFLALGTLAERDGKTTLARLSYQAFLRIAPDDPNAAAVKTKLKSLT